MVWLAWCAAVWWALPVRPRAEWTIPPNQIFLGFVPRTNAALVAAFDRERLLGPLQLREIDSGHSRTFLADHGAIGQPLPSPDGRWIALIDLGNADNLLSFLDTASGEVHAVAMPADSHINMDCIPARFSPDGRLLAIPEHSLHADCIHLVDVSYQNLWMTVGPADYDYVFSADSRWMAYTESDQLHVLDLSDGTVRHSFPTPDRATPVSFTADASGIVFRRELGRAVESSTWGFCCCEVNSGRRRWSVDGTIGDVVEDGRLLLVVEDDGDAIAMVSYDTADGHEFSRARFEFSLYAPLSEMEFYPTCIPNHRTMITSFNVGPRESELAYWFRENVRNRLVGQSEETYTLVDSATGQVLGRIPTQGYSQSFSSDGRLVALNDGHVIRIWDIPPRKPVKWFVVAAALLALPLVWLARRRVRRLRLPVA
jgi:hypothetical protein